MTRKYTHSKPKLVRFEDARKTDRRKEENRITAKRILGPDFPEFGASLGTIFDPGVGLYTKARRVLSLP